MNKKHIGLLLLLITSTSCVLAPPPKSRAVNSPSTRTASTGAVRGGSQTPTSSWANRQDTSYVSTTPTAAQQPGRLSQQRITDLNSKFDAIQFKNKKNMKNNLAENVGEMPQGPKLPDGSSVSNTNFRELLAPTSRFERVTNYVNDLATNAKKFVKQVTRNVGDVLTNRGVTHVRPLNSHEIALNRYRDLRYNSKSQRFTYDDVLEAEKNSKLNKEYFTNKEKLQNSDRKLRDTNYREDMIKISTEGIYSNLANAGNAVARSSRAAYNSVFNRKPKNSLLDESPLENNQKDMRDTSASKTKLQTPAQIDPNRGARINRSDAYKKQLEELDEIYGIRSQYKNQTTYDDGFSPEDLTTTRSK